MQIPRGTNKLGARASLEQRTIYQTLPQFPEGSDKSGKLIDLWSENSLYGRFQDGYSIAPSEEFLKAFPRKSANESVVSALCFVVDAYADLRNFLEKKLSCPEDSLFIPMKPVKGFRSVKHEYEQYIADYYNSFFNEYVKKFGMQRKIKDIRDFSSKLVDYVFILGGNLPFFKSEFLATRFCSPRTSGLIVEFDKQKYSEDFPKFQYLIHNHFPLYLGAAARFGFMVDKNVPWRLVFNVFSSGASYYLLEYGISNVFTDIYDRILVNELEEFKELLARFYVSYFDAIGADNGAAKLDSAALDLLSKDNEFWFNLYYKIRRKNYKRSKSGDTSESREVAKRATFFDNSVDRKRAMMYIEAEILK